MFVVVVGAGHDQFVEDDPAGVEAREVEAGADQHEPAAARQLPEAGLGGDTDARCLETHVGGLVDGEAGVPGGLEVVRMAGRGPES